jgi:hypothetical protein
MKIMFLLRTNTKNWTTRGNDGNEEEEKQKENYLKVKTLKS